jgi:hypothetical protein
LSDRDSKQPSASKIKFQEKRNTSSLRTSDTGLSPSKKEDVTRRKRVPHTPATAKNVIFNNRETVDASTISKERAAELNAERSFKNLLQQPKLATKTFSSNTLNMKKVLQFLDGTNGPAHLYA